MTNEQQTKKCTMCKEDKSLDDFHIHTKEKGWRQSRCKKCHYDYNYENVRKALHKRYHEDEEYRLKMIAASADRVKRLLQEDPEFRETHNQRCREYYHENKEKILTRRKELKELKKEQQELLELVQKDLEIQQLREGMKARSQREQNEN